MKVPGPVPANRLITFSFFLFFTGIFAAAGRAAPVETPSLEQLTASHLKNPLDPEALYGIALVHEQEGAPVLALMWIEALKELSLDADVKREVTALSRKLETEIEKRITQLLALAEETILSFPASLEEGRRQALGALVLLHSARGDFEKGRELKKDSIYRDAPEHALKRYYGENRAAVHDYAKVDELLEEIEPGTSEGKLWESLFNYQLLRGEYAQALRTLERMAPSAKRTALIERAAVELIRALRLDGAWKFIELEKDPEKRLHLQDRYAEGLLKSGAVEEAGRLAEEFFSSGVSIYFLTPWVLRHPAGEVMSAIGREPVREQLPLLYRAALNFAWLENFEFAAQACSALREIEARQDPSSALYSDFACAGIEMERGSLESLHPLIQNYPPRVSYPFVQSFFWRLGARGRYEDAESLARAVADPHRRIPLLHALSGMAASEPGSTPASRLASESYALALAHKDSLTLRAIALGLAAGRHEDWFVWATLQNEKILRWTRLADASAQHESILNLKSYLQKNKSPDLRTLAQSFLEAAGQWNNALLAIQGLRHWHHGASW